MDKNKVKQYLVNAQKALLRYEKAGDKSSFTRAFNLIQDAEIELSKTNWVSVDERLPINDEWVWVSSRQYPDSVWKSLRPERIAKNSSITNILDSNGFVSIDPHITITHWKPIEKLEE